MKINMTETRHEFFIRRMRELGAYDADADYAGMIGRSIEALSKVFSEQGHSGGSADVTLGLWNQLFKEWEEGGH